MSDIDILLVEDNPEDIHLIEQTFEDRNLQGSLYVVKSGTEAFDWLHQRDEFADAPRPDLVLMDLNLPAISGQTVLEKIKSDDQLKWMPVIVLTGSKSETELINAYETYANACLIKPVDPEEFADLIQTVTEFWDSTVALTSISDSVDDPQR